jgi:hypothetical protein
VLPWFARDRPHFFARLVLARVTSEKSWLFIGIFLRFFFVLGSSHKLPFGALSAARLLVATNMVVLPDRVASMLRRLHRALPAPVHCAAFDDGSDILSLATGKPRACNAARELHRETLNLTNGVRACAVCVLWRAAGLHEWVTAACAVFVLDVMDVYRTVFAVAAHNVGAKQVSGEERNTTLLDTLDTLKSREKSTRDAVRLVTLLTLGMAVKTEADGMIDTFDAISLALGEGNAGAFTARQHVRGCLLTIFWLSLVTAVAAPKVANVFVSTLRALSIRTGRRLSPSSPTKDTSASPFGGWAGPDKPFWVVFSLHGDWVRVGAFPNPDTLFLPRS